VVDPFCGSGTVLQECIARNRPVYGFEINPAAYAMSRFFTLSKFSRDERLALMRCVENVFHSILPPFADLPLLEPGEDYAVRISNLMELAREVFARTTGKHETLLGLLVLFETENWRLSNLNEAIS